VYKRQRGLGDVYKRQVVSALAHHLPSWVGDYGSGTAKALRDTVDHVVLARVGPKPCGTDSGALKGVKDTVCTWLQIGGFVSAGRWVTLDSGKLQEFDTGKIGAADDVLEYDPAVNPRGRLSIVLTQEIRSRGPARYGCVIELHSR
jgi:hypothetical protein